MPTEDGTGSKAGRFLDIKTMNNNTRRHFTFQNKWGGNGEWAMRCSAMNRPSTWPHRTCCASTQQPTPHCRSRRNTSHALQRHEPAQHMAPPHWLRIHTTTNTTLQIGDSNTSSAECGRVRQSAAECGRVRRSAAECGRHCEELLLIGGTADSGRSSKELQQR